MSYRWLASYFEQKCGYEHRVDVEECSKWDCNP